MIGSMRAVARLAAGAAAFAAAGVLIVSSAHEGAGGDPVLEQAAAAQRRPAAARGRVQMLYAPNLPDANPLDDFDAGFKQGKFRKAKTEENVFEGFDRGFKQPPFRALADEENPFDETPDNYPFDETAGGHAWKHWDGDSPMQALHESNVLDTGAPDEAFKLGEHTLGRPFKAFKPEANVFDQLSTDGETYQWGATDKSVPEKNVLAGLSPDSGYPDENGE